MPGTVLGRQYLIGRVLGMGAFGVTYLGLDLKLLLKVAVKEYLPRNLASRSPDGLTVEPFSTESQSYRAHLGKFLDEGRRLARLATHPNVVQVLGFEEAFNTGYLVMQHVEGLSLSRYLADNAGMLDDGQKVQILQQILDGLEAVHAAGLLHRDLKPDNVIITRKGQLKLIDFGAARENSSGNPRGRDDLTVQYTPGYAPPEQYSTDGRAQGPWTDIYGVGAIAYRMIVGAPPPDALELRSGAADLLSPTELLGPRVSAALSEIIMKALAMEPAERYQSIAELRDALRSHYFSRTPVQPVMIPLGELELDAIDGSKDTAYRGADFDVLPVANDPVHTTRRPQLPEATQSATGAPTVRDAGACRPSAVTVDDRRVVGVGDVRSPASKTVALNAGRRRSFLLVGGSAGALVLVGIGLFVLIGGKKPGASSDGRNSTSPSRPGSSKESTAGMPVAPASDSGDRPISRTTGQACPGDEILVNGECDCPSNTLKQPDNRCCPWGHRLIDGVCVDPARPRPRPVIAPPPRPREVPNRPPPPPRPATVGAETPRKVPDRPPPRRRPTTMGMEILDDDAPLR
jgi:serine/threonine protein kinase